MSVGTPTGYRLPAGTGLASVSRLLLVHARDTRRDEAARAVGRVLADLVRRRGHDVLAVHSRGQVAGDHPALPAGLRSGLLVRAAAFVDAVQDVLRDPSATPVPAWLDLRVELRFADDPADDRAWTYALLATESFRMEAAWRQVEGVQEYPVASTHDLPGGWVGDPVRAERRAVWDRVLAPYAHDVPLAWVAPAPTLRADVEESLRTPADDASAAAGGRVTVPLVLQHARELLGPHSGDDLLARAIGPLPVG